MEIREALKDRKVRIETMATSFPLFFAYHFGRKFTNFHMMWMRSLQSDKNTMIVAFRASRKTTLVRGFVVWCIVYKKEPSIIRQSYEDSLSGESVREIAKMLNKGSVVQDHGVLFPFSTKKEDFAKKALSNFETTNGVKVESKSLGQTLRGANTYDVQEEMSSRPTLLILDDIDVTKSVNNVEIINNNEKKILGETIGALDPLRRKIIFLGNIINDDGVVPRFRNNYKNSERWNCFKQPLFDDQGNNTRPEVFTDEVVAEVQADGKTSYNQNYLLIPSSLGTGVFTRDYFDYFLLSHFEQVDSPLKKHDLRVWLFIDPAFSTSVNSDDAVVIGAGEHKASKAIYVIEGYADTSAPSRTIQNILAMYYRLQGMWYTPTFVSVEDVSINKEQLQFIKDLRAELLKHKINIPVYLYRPKNKKEIRIKDNIEGIMSQKWIKFNRNMSDVQFVTKMERQLLEFPNWDHDDIADTLSQCVEVFRSHVEEESTVYDMPNIY